jgi:serine phosphatase RsbU (regulator of sigma subunit)
MSGYPVYLLGLVLVVLWRRRSPTPRLSRLLGFWWLGLLIHRFGPVGLSAFIETETPSPALSVLAGACEWAGSVLLLYCLATLATWSRRRERASRVRYALLVAALLVGGIPGQAWAALLTVPWLWSMRWREGLSARPLLLASMTALLSLVILSLELSVGFRDGSGGRGFESLAQFGRACALIYSFLALPRVASRIHLSIRRIRTRLFVSHLLAGLVPVCLSSLFLILASALFLSTYRGEIASRWLERRAEDARRNLLASFGASDEMPAAPFGIDVEGQRVIARIGGGPFLTSGPALDFSAESLMSQDASSDTLLCLWDGKLLFVRARIDTVLGGRAVLAEALAPVDSLDMAALSGLINMPVRINPSLTVSSRGEGIAISPLDDESPVSPIGPEQKKSTLPGGAVVPSLVWDGEAWNRAGIPVLSSASLLEPLLSLIPIARTNPLATVVLIALGVIAVFIFIVFWVTVGMVVSMGKSVATAVGGLTKATRSLGGGDLSHRIDVKGKDELWDVAASFNTMAEGLGRVRAMELANQRLEEELRLARDIQTRLLPKSPPEIEHLELAGLSLPAREVGGDYFDYIVVDGGQVAIAVADVSGKGVPAALLMSSFRASLRSQDIARLGPGEILGHVNRFVHASVDPGKFITAFLGLLDPATGGLRYANAGHEPPLVLSPGGGTAALSEGGLVLGMQAQARYGEARIELAPGDLLAVFTDGVTEALDPEGEFYGLDRFEVALRRESAGHCSQVLRSIMKELKEHSGAREQSDDITVVLARLDSVGR